MSGPDPARAASQTQFLNVLGREEAARLFRSHLDLQPRGTEEVSLAESTDRVLACDVRSECDVTAFDRSNVDGFAVVAASTVGATEETPVRLQLNDEVLTPGLEPQQVVEPGTATVIATGAMVPRGDEQEGGFDPDQWVEPKEQRRIDDFILYAIGAASQAIADSGWTPADEDARERAGVMIGSGIGGLPGIYDSSVTLHERGPRRVSPFFIPSTLINLASGHVSIRFGLKGPNHAAVTACSTGAPSPCPSPPRPRRCSACRG